MLTVRSNLAERSVLNLLGHRDGVTVADLADSLSMPDSSAVAVLGRLLERGQIFRRELAETGKPSRGRRRYRYGLRLQQPLLAFVLDGSQLAGAILDQDQDVVALERMHVPLIATLDDAGRLLQTMQAMLLASAAISARNIGAAAVCINAIEAADATHSSTVLPWVDRRVQETFTRCLGLPVQLMPTPILTAEYQLLAASAPPSLAYLHVGDGVSGHFCMDGLPCRGATRRGGELGHITVDPQGPLCACGRRGCLETLTSGPALMRQAHGAAARRRAPKWLRQAAESDAPRVVVGQLWQAWQEDLPQARQLLEPALDHLAWGLSLLMNMLDPACVVIGGYVLDQHPQWVDHIVDKARGQILAVDQRPLNIRPAQATLADQLRVIAVQYQQTQLAQQDVA